MTLLRVQNLSKHYPVRGGVFSKVRSYIHAADDINFEISKGQTLGLVGESGCGKSTVGRLVAALTKPTGGKIFFEDQDIHSLDNKKLREIRKSLQIVFQDPLESLNQRMTVEEILVEPFVIHKVGSYPERIKSIRTLLDLVGLPAQSIGRYPYEFSGGQRQRIGIARAVALNPKLVVCDEAVSALDVSVQAQIMNLLCKLQKEFGLSYLFIAHGLSVVKHMSDRVAVMYLGKIVESASSEELYKAPMHPYTQALISSIPDPTGVRSRIKISGDVPSAQNPPSGCRFRTRCPLAQAICAEKEPKLNPLNSHKDHVVACHFVK